jgi:tRNA 2-thiocytidine biosynthesis protein TtcA
MADLLRSTSLVGEMADEVAACLATYDLLPPGTAVAVAISGGVDSWALLALLSNLIETGRLDAKLTALHIELGHPGADERLGAITDGCRAAGVPLVVRRTSIGPAAVADGGKRPCFLCARGRRQALYESADREGCAFIATGHHRDDVLATFLLNLIESREVSTLMPRQPAFGGRFQLVRPLYTTPKSRLEKLQAQQGFPVVASGCPVDGSTRRREAEDLLAGLEKARPGAADAIFAALHRVKPDFMPQRAE